jgi:hypothetical protein
MRHSRGDYYFGDDHTFSQVIWDQTKAYFTGPVIDLKTAADARLARMYTSNATNPTFGLNQVGLVDSFGETAAYITILGDQQSGKVNTSWVIYLFGKSTFFFPLVLIQNILM